jgi:hypothetical protein
MINYEYELNTICYEYTTNTYDSWVTRYDTITIYYDRNRIVIILGQPYSQGSSKGHALGFSVRPTIPVSCVKVAVHTNGILCHRLVQNNK